MTGFRRTSYSVATCLALAALTAGPAAAQQPNGVTPAVPPTAVPPQNPPAPVPPPAAGAQTFQVPLNADPVIPVPRFNFKIHPRTPTKDLLPPAPKLTPITGPVLTDELARVPEIEFQAGGPRTNQKFWLRDELAKSLESEFQPTAAQMTDAEKQVQKAALQLAKINHLNAKKSDAFMTALLESRPDLAGVSFVMGDDCRATGARVQHFTQAAETVRRALGGTSAAVTGSVSLGNFRATATVPPPAPQTGTPQAPNQLPVTHTVVVQTSDGQELVPVTTFTGQQVGTPQSFWQRYATLCEQEDGARTRPDKETTEHVTLARLAALTQILAAEAPEIRLGLVKYLTGVPHVEATKALARMAIFSSEDDIRAAAIAALKVRREKDYTDIIVKGLRYPWPAVARRAADALVKLDRTDVIPELVAVLDAADPRLPETKEVDGKVLVREMVKLNHHRNCVMCHAPAGSGTPNPNALTAEVAVQGLPLPLPSEGYRQETPELMIRIDVTYLRPDFSVSMPVKDAHPWPEMQRFDFLVRERKLTAEQAVAYRETLKPAAAGVLSPYHKAALAALRELTGKDTAPTAEAWRKLLDLPARE